MPKSFVVIFSSSRGCDQTGRLLVESNGKLEGGVRTDILIPFNLTTATDINTTSGDSALNFAVSKLR